jgi:hypothetical protein
VDGLVGYIKGCIGYFPEDLGFGGILEMFEGLADPHGLQECIV